MHQFLSLPAGVRNVMYLLTGTSLIGAISFFDARLALIVGIGLAMIAAAVASFFSIRSWIRGKRARSMASELTQHSSSSPTGLSDAAGRAELDRLRQKFLEGLSKFGSVENTYKFPWYLVVGEPGSGKTEAIRHCNVGFPPGMQDELQGTGGTINMNWWFTNQAVFLDTAGKMMFKDVKPGETSEWKEFLQLLLRNRPNCPINGLLLIIPADALIKDTDAQLHEKASRIAQQFEVIQRTLDIRFPVFVVVTKCDLLSGFREFFDDFADVNSINQMLGWSNPEDRDKPFEPDRVTDHLTTVVDRIKKRRLSILRDPIPRDTDRRADEVDALYALPQSFQLIAPRMRMYLEKIFVAGPWSPKPLFLRGIYFTSSMREGNALDQELAQALGIAADNLPDGKVWVKERPYFLRDIFTEKVFRERGLVTRATNTKKMLRKRSLILWGTASALALGFIGFTLYAYRQFSDSIKVHSDMWTAAKDPKDWDARPGHWRPIVSPDRPEDTVVKYRGTEPPIQVGSKDMSLVAFHDRLKDVARQPIDAGWVYRPMLAAAKIDDQRLKAQRIVFESSTVFPLVDAARNRMLREAVANAADRDEPGDTRFEREAKALQALIRIEADKVSATRKPAADVPENVFMPLLQYSTATRLPLPEEFRATFDYTYNQNPAGSWVPEKLDLGAANLAANKPIEAGLGRLLELADSSLSQQRSAAGEVAKLRDDFRAFREVERDMNSIAKGLSSPEEKEEKLKEQLAKLGVLKAEIDKKLEAEFMDQNAPSMKQAYTKLVTESQAQSGARFAQLRETVKPLVEHPTAKLFADIDKRLTEAQATLNKSLEDTFTKEDQEELDALDAYLAEYQDGGVQSRVYAGRYATYKKVEEVANEKDPTENLIGSGWKPYANARATFKDLRSLIVSRQSDLSGGASKTRPLPDFVEPCNRLLDSGENRRLQLIANAYLQQSIGSVETGLFFPFVMTSERAPAGYTMTMGRNLLLKWEQDFNSETYPSVPDSVKNRLNAIKEVLEAMKRGPEQYAKLEAENKKETDRYREEVKSHRFDVSVSQQNTWKTANGKDIYSVALGSSVPVGSFGYDGSLDITLRDSATGASTSFSVNRGHAPSTSRSGVSISIQERGTRPKPPQVKKFEPPEFTAPIKADLLQKLRGTGN